MYYNFNSRYGVAMCESLPYGLFAWVENFEQCIGGDIPDDAETGYILKVDLEYSRELHDTHNDLPLYPQHFAPPGQTLKEN